MYGNDVSINRHSLPLHRKDIGMQGTDFPISKHNFRFIQTDIGINSHNPTFRAPDIAIYRQYITWHRLGARLNGKFHGKHGPNPPVIRHNTSRNGHKLYGIKNVFIPKGNNISFYLCYVTYIHTDTLPKLPGDLSHGT